MTDSQTSVTIRILGTPVGVAAGLTVLEAVQAAGYGDLAGCGCRLGDCGECRIALGWPGRAAPSLDLACQETVAEGLEVYELPFRWTLAFRQATLPPGTGGR